MSSRGLIRMVLVICFVSAIAAQGAVLKEDGALNFLLQTLKHDHVYDKRISLDCVSFGTEETKKDYFEFVLRENHTAKCGGDPDVSPVVDRYRVYRASRKIDRYDAVNDSWQRYNPAKSK